MKRRDDFEDDGRVVLDMNAPGMPWYRAPGKRGECPDEAGEASPGETERLTRRQTLRAVVMATLAGLTVFGVFALILVLFIAFCVFVWLR